jgi:hypothetical protein
LIVCDVPHAVRAGLDFLADSQLPNGAFTTLCSYRRDLANAYVGRSPFLTTFILHSIRVAQGLAADNQIGSLGIEYLLSECESPGIWRFSGRGSQLSADLDDTCCALAVLKEYETAGLDYSLLCEYLLQFRDASGLFYTWMDYPSAYNDVDPVVNANVLLFYSLMKKPLRTVADHLIGVLHAAASTGTIESLYYLSPLSLLYSLCRVSMISPEDLRPPARQLLENVDKHDPLASAMMLNALLDLNISDHTESLRDAIIQMQSPDGSWEPAAFFKQPNPEVYYGSRELTTALCLEALAKTQHRG